MNCISGSKNVSLVSQFDLPLDWKVVRVKFLVDAIQTGSTPSTNNNDYFDGNINWFTPGDYNEGTYLVNSSKKISTTALVDKEARLFPKDTVAIVGIGGTLGKVGVLFKEASFNQQITGIQTNKLLLPEFLYYWLYINKEVLIKTANYTTLPIINNQFIKEFYCILPPNFIQRNIVDYLNNKSKSIFEVIKLKERLLKKLEEKRQAIITEAITKGLNSNVKMKDSGVEWIGEIPGHWKVKPLYTVYKENKMKNKDNLINNVLSLSYGKIKRRDIESNYGLLPDSFETYQIVENGYLVLRLTDLQNDKKSLRVGLVNETGVITSAYVGLKNSPLVNSRYAYYLLHSYDLAKVYYGLGSGVRQSMGYAELKKLPILIPDLNEQEEIVRYLDKMNTQTADIIKDLKSQIQKLKEYRQSLIYEAVTGKIDVRDFEIEA